MPEVVKKIKINCVGVIILTAILVFIASNSLYYHSHKLKDGTIIEHAHPFNKSQDQSPFKTHKHTSIELFILDHLQLLFFTLDIIVILSSALFIQYLLPSESHLIFLSSFHTSLSRAPPVSTR